MQSLWSDAEAAVHGEDALALRVYTSNLIGREPDLVVHGGGNTSVKLTRPDFFGDPADVLLVKGSGWDLETILAEGFSPVRMSALLRLAELPSLSDSDMVREQRAAMTDPSAPSPSVEAILHALIPYRFVDHTHSDAVVAVTNAALPAEEVRDVFGPRMLIVPYVMPGFELARAVRDLTRDVEWSELDGLVLSSHGIFTFGDTARASYERMIETVTRAEDFLAGRGAHEGVARAVPRSLAAADLLRIAALRGRVSSLRARERGRAVLARLSRSPESAGFAARADAVDLVSRGPLTPDHVIHTKPRALALSGDPDLDDAGLEAYAQAYTATFRNHDPGGLTMLDPAPRWALWPGTGVLAFGDSPSRLRVVEDIAAHTMKAAQWAEAVGRWTPLPVADLFQVEYWELEQAKLARGGAPPLLEGRVALVTGAASGIGRATAEHFLRDGAAVVAVDRSDEVVAMFDGEAAVAVRADVTDPEAVRGAVETAVLRFGGLDCVVSNAGAFPASRALAEIDGVLWRESLEVNLTSHLTVMRASWSYLELGIDPSFVILASKNVPAPGPGMAAYSVPKAGLTQLARVAALEGAPRGIRVNVLHPDAVFDTAAWNETALRERAEHYGMTVEEYRSRNLLGTEVSSADVAALAVALASPLFAKTTGAQIPVDGGSERVI